MMLRLRKQHGLLLSGVAVLLLLLQGNSVSWAQAPKVASPQTMASKTYRFINGKWFDGKAFVGQEFYSVDGLLRRKSRDRPNSQADAEVIDLKGGYVVPPFGDAHCHHFDSSFNVAQQTQMYLQDGIFYVKVLTNSLKGAREIANQVNIPTGIDVIYAHGGLTGNNSHPIPTYEGLGLGYYNDKDWASHKDEVLKSRRRENDCYYIVDTPTDLDKKWPLILAGKPDFIKVYLLQSEDYEKRKQAQGYGEGIDPKLLPQIVARAHKAGLRVSAHVDSAMDFHNALIAGVDEMAHLPGYYISKSETVAAYHLADNDIALAAKRRVSIVPTANHADYIAEEQDRERTRVNMKDNMARLKQAGVKFGIGTDSYGTDSLKEALYLSKTGVWNNLEMLKMWCENTPHFSFPKRKIGRLHDGYEASFLVLDKNPLEQFENVQTIRLRFKQGHFIVPSK